MALNVYDSLFSQDPVQSPLLRWALSTRHFSPKVEAQRQTHRDLLGEDRTDLDVLLVTSPHQILRVRSPDQLQHFPAQLDQLTSDRLAHDQFLFFPPADEHCLDGGHSAPFPVFFVFYNLENTSLRPHFQRFHDQLVALVPQGWRYCFRHAATPPHVEASLPRLQAQGYEAEFSLKSLEYKAINQPSPATPQAAAAASGAVAGAADPDWIVSQYEQLNVSHVPYLGYLAAQYLVDAPDFLAELTHLTQNFPLLAPTIAALPLKNDTLSAIHQFQMAHQLPSGTELLLLNGRALDLKTLDPYSLYEAIQEEAQLHAALVPLPLLDSAKAQIPYLSASPSHTSILRFDVRSPSIDWLNDLTRDAMYAHLSRSLTTLLQADPFNPFRPIRKNVLNAVLFWSAFDLRSLNLFGQLAQSIAQGIPLRFGVVVVTAYPASHPHHEAERQLARALHSILSSKREMMEKMQLLFGLFQIVRDAPALQPLHVNQFLDYTGLWTVPDSVDERLTAANRFVSKLGFHRDQSTLFLNGMLLSAGNLFQELMMKTMHMEYPLLESLIAAEKLTSENSKKSDDVYNLLLSQPSVLPKFNAQLMAQPLTVAALGFTELQALHFLYLQDPSSQEVSIQKLTYQLFVDLDTPPGIALAYAAVSQLSHRTYAPHIRVTFVDITAGHSLTWRVIQAALQSHSPFGLEAAQKFVIKLLLKRLSDEGAAAPQDIAAIVADLAERHLRWPDKFRTQLEAASTVAAGQAQTEWARQRGFSAGDLLLNGRLYHLEPAHLAELDHNDFNFLDAMEISSRINAIFGFEEGSFLDTLEFSADIDIDDQTAALRADVMIAILSILGTTAPQQSRRSLSRTGFLFASSDTTAQFSFKYVLDPLAGSGSRVLPLLQALLALNPPDRAPVFSVEVGLLPAVVEKLPLQKFSRYVLAAAPAGTTALFTGLPQSRLLTLQLLHPHSWLVQTTFAQYDLDNLILNQVTEKKMIAKYQLDHLLFQGSCSDQHRMPPQGLQMTLSRDTASAVYADTLVMINFGYFQLKGNPGLWTLRMAPGRAQQLYTFADNAEESPVAISSWSGLESFALKVAKRPGMEQLSLVDVDSPATVEAPAEPASVWSTLSDLLTGGGSPAAVSAKNQTIHVFSLASGHLYERFLKIMILSVLNHTESPVKFWLLKNYLSPEFKALLPKMAAHFGFEFEFVTYQWPVWLRGQTEKQRIMWAYKILFLDVLFPLSLDRIIFVDADQIVRADLKELMELDLEGAPYAYTPFCDSRREMDGFRFWKQGFWETHLRGRPYHISALYVVDLKRFRRIAAGDQLRATYDSLAADPNSLANLDQDLPNYLQSMVRIYSLPSEWLWCETWCDDDSLKTAKTIDLCNNPLTKAPKLENAVRIVAEWTTLDDNVKKFEKLVASTVN